jgi:hypothetical protein
MSVRSWKTSDEAQETTNRSMMRLFNEGTVSPHEQSGRKVEDNGGEERTASIDVAQNSGSRRGEVGYVNSILNLAPQKWPK